ncbi:MAG: class I SAM-dependent methyltransferase [Terriglobia bacterium]
MINPLPSDQLEKSQTKSVWGAKPAGSIFAKDLTPGTFEFFEKTMKARNEYEMPRVLDLIPFASMGRRKVLELGCGAGYDALAFCRNQADYTGIDLTPENIQRTRTHLEYFGYHPDIQEGDAEHLSFASSSFDVVYSNGVLHHTPHIEKSFAEAYRVLTPGGRFWVILYYRHSIFYWITLGLVDHCLRMGFTKRSFSERLAMIEYTTSQALPGVRVYSRRDLRQLLNSAGFSVEGLWVRKLNREDLPAIPIAGRLWKWIPQSWLDSLGKRWGWYLIAEARK